MRYNLYPAEQFGISGNPDVYERFAVLVKLNSNGIETGEALAVYIVNDDPYMPPFADMQNADPIEVKHRPEGLMPTFHNVDINNTGRMVFPVHGRTWTITQEQQTLLASPQALYTDRGEFWANESGTLVKDESLISVPAKRMKQDELYRVLNEKYSALLDRTHTQYGWRFPVLPCAKYFEEQDKTVVFIAASQLKYVSERILDGEEAFYRDRANGDVWNIHTTYGVCIIDDLHDPDHYSVKLISPYQLDLYIERAGCEIGPNRENIRENYQER